MYERDSRGFGNSYSSNSSYLKSGGNRPSSLFDRDIGSFDLKPNRSYTDFKESSVLNSGGDGYKRFDKFSASDRLNEPSSNMNDMRIQHITQEMNYMRADNELIKNAVQVLEKDRDNLRQAIRKLKVENSRMRTKLKRLGAATGHGDDDDGITFDDIDYEDVKDFILVGGPKDPFSLRFEAAIKDSDDKEHKSAERYLWFKMAMEFGDEEAAEKIRTADTGAKAEEEMGKIKNFDEAAWNVVKMKYWEEGQKLKFDQVRWIQSLLVFSDPMYIAIASQDKLWGTGWRKQREEAGQPRMWDGENEGGKTCMKLRATYKADHKWEGDDEEKETKKKYEDLKRTFWRRIQKRDFDDGDGGGRGGRGGRGGFGGRGGGGRGRGGRGDNKRGRY